MFNQLTRPTNWKVFIITRSFKERLSSGELLNNGLLKLLLYTIILVNAVGLLFPVLGSNDSYFYSVVAKHIIVNHDWINLTFAGNDWLDKPHLPFWLTAISYSFFGVNTFAYILPGFIFNLIGAFYTYRLGKHLYSNQVGMLASIFYLSSIHLLLSSIDVRAEAYLLGEIMPACYYWYLYNEAEVNANNSLRSSRSLLILGSIFTAMAVMTKGIFVILTIFSGILVLNLYNKRAKEFLTQKWRMAYFYIILFILPELLSLFLQFDLHPEKIIFGHHGVSGLKFFFWDSQFGRFFETGPITIGKSHTYSHYFFFTHTFLWAFLPWTVFFIAAIIYAVKKTSYSTDAPNRVEQNSLNIYLWASFLPTFILFSLTKFQLDHYTNILIPFAAILSAQWVCNRATRLNRTAVFYLQTTIALVIIIAMSILAFFLLTGLLFIVSASLCAVVMALIVILNNNSPLNKSIVNPLMAVSLAFIIIMFINGRIYPHYDLGYNLANYLEIQNKYPIFDYNVNSNSLEFHVDNRYQRVNSLVQLSNYKPPYYLVINAKDYAAAKSVLPLAVLLQTFTWIPQEKFIPSLFNINIRQKNQESADLLLIQASNQSK